MSEPRERWLQSAADDLSFAELGFENGYYSQVCFLSQQAAEKGLKGVLESRTGGHPRIHNLVALVNQVACHVPEMADLEDTARILDQYYLPSRYPDGVPPGSTAATPSQTNAREALEGARRILSSCEKRIMT